MRVEVEPSSTSPLYRQIADQIRGGIARGEVVAGQRLPVARDLATELDVNLQTVLRAYAALREEGLERWDGAACGGRPWEDRL